jgi:lipid II:glycine glycyltransferase (peptidoglycan interpeptide bridge formation enzyme)
MPPGGVLLDLQRTDLSFCDEAASFLQSGFWGSFKARFGWEALAFRAAWRCGEGGGGALSAGEALAGNDASFETKPVLVLRRRFAPGLSLAYIPWGPELPARCSGRDAAVRELAGALKKILPGGTVFIRFDPPWYSEYPGASPPPPFIRSGADIQPPDTVLINLAQPMESLMEQMKPKWRYNARLALKKGVAVRRAGAGETGVFYSLLEETARRDGIVVHGIEYYRALLEHNRNGGMKPDIRLYIAEHENDALAGIVTLFRGREAVYLYGASSGKKRSLMAPYALQLKAIEDAKAHGCEKYDLFGIPPDEDPSHPMAGLYKFKTGFGGRIIHRPGSWDYPCRPLFYWLFNRAEALRKNLRAMKKLSRKDNKAAETVSKRDFSR